MIYKYKCPKCEYVYTEFKSIDERYDSNCQICGTKSIKQISSNIGCFIGSKFRDSRGERIWFPKDNRPYFDYALRMTFNTPEEKQSYMKENNLVMDGSTTKTRLPVEAGDKRDKSYRRQMKMED